jgi:hypothetical protein
MLERHKGTARSLGASGQQEDDFLDSVAYDKSRSQAFRGVAALFNSPFEVVSTGKFRGLNGLTARNAYPLNKPPFAPPAEKNVNVQEADQKQKFDNVQQVIPEDALLFLRNESLNQLLRENNELRDAFINGDYVKVNEKLAQAAKENLGWSPGLTQSFLEQHPDAALAITADLGEASSLMTDDEAVDALTGKIIERAEDEVFSALAEKASLFFVDAPLLDEDFFKEHPKAALYLHENPEEVRRIDGNRTAERDFFDHVVTYEALVDPVAIAQEFASDNTAVGDAFWEDNPDLALVLYAEKAADLGHSLQTSAIGFPEEAHESTTPFEMAAHNQARQAQQILGNNTPMDLNFLKSHPGFTRVIVENPTFGENLAEDDKVSDFIGSDDKGTNQLLRSYVSGFAGRSSSSWQWWA